MLRGRGRQLVFRAVSLSEAGLYDCVARNSEGNQSAAIQLTVHGESEAPVPFTTFVQAAEPLGARRSAPEVVRALSCT